MSDHLRGYGWRHATWCRWEKAEGTCDCGLREHQDAASPPAADPLDVTPEILAHALDDVLREEAYDASKDGPSTGFTIPSMDEDEYTRDLFMERGAALYARLAARAAATEDTE